MQEKFKLEDIFSFSFWNFISKNKNRNGGN